MRKSLIAMTAAFAASVIGILCLLYVLEEFRSLARDQSTVIRGMSCALKWSARRDGLALALSQNKISNEEFRMFWNTYIQQTVADCSGVNS